MRLNTLHITFLIWFMLLALSLSSQSITIAGSGSGTPDPSAILDLQDTERGFLPPRMTTTQMNAVNSPADGLLIFNTDSINFFFYNGSSWINVASATLSSGELYTANGNVGIGTTNPRFDLEVAGSEGKQISTVNIGTANQIDDLAISDTANVIRLTGADSDADLTGIVSDLDGRIIHLINSTGHKLTIKHNSGSLVANRFFLRGENDRNMDEFQISSFIYSSADGGWLLMSEH